MVWAWFESGRDRCPAHSANRIVEDTVRLGGRTVLKAKVTIPGAAGPAPAGPARPPLSRREWEALCWIARGLTHQQTATRMRVGKPTVDTYVARARVKLKLG